MHHRLHVPQGGLNKKSYQDQGAAIASQSEFNEAWMLVGGAHDKPGTRILPVTSPRLGQVTNPNNVKCVQKRMVPNVSVRVSLKSITISP